MTDDLPIEVRSAATERVPVRTLYEILALRAETFVVEQDCVYLDLDGRDLEPETLQVWIGDPVVGSLRLLTEPDGSVKIGRVVVARSRRGEGIADVLMAAASRLADGRRVVLDAQSRLAGWYERLGFRRVGEDFLEDGIAHTPMQRLP